MDIDSAVAEYSERRPIYEQMGLRLRSLLSELFDESGIPYQLIESRAKDPESFRKKLQTKLYDEPLRDCKDLCGVRVVALDLDAAAAIGNLLRQEFTIDEAHTSDKLTSLGPDKFGYRSLHYVLSFTDGRASLREYRRYSGLYAEIQVRTVLQHAWAAIDHKLRYKSEADVPESVRRRLFRVSALLEEADESFQHVKRSIDEHRSSVVVKVSNRELVTDIDFDSLSEYLKRTEALDWLSSGLNMNHYYITDSVGNSFDKDVSVAITLCALLGIRDLAHLEKVLDAAKLTFLGWMEDLYMKAYNGVRHHLRVHTGRASLVPLVLFSCVDPSLPKEAIQGAGFGKMAEPFVKVRDSSMHTISLAKLFG